MIDKVIASSFQTFIREDYPVFLLMTGLFENIRNLQNEDTLTFLYRTPRIELKPLGIIGMANNNGKMRTRDVQEASGNTSGSFSTYRKRLSERGLIDTSSYGYIELTLPRFGDVVRAFG